MSLLSCSRARCQQLLLLTAGSMGLRGAFRLSVGFLHHPLQATRPSLLQYKDSFQAAGLSTSQLVRTDGEEQQDQSTTPKDSRIASAQRSSLVSLSVFHLARFSRVIINLT